MTLCMNNVTRKNAGFTLIELMFTISIAAILLAVGVPSLTTMMDNNNMASSYNGLLGDIAFVRSESLRTRSPVVMCPTTDAKNLAECDGANWSGGWLAFIDNGAGTPGNAGNRTVDAGEQIVRVSQAMSGGIIISTDGFPNNDSVLFSPNGKIENGAPDNVGVFIVCNGEDDERARGIAFTAFGQHRAMRDTNESGVLDYELFDADGDPTVTEVECK